MYCRRWPSGDSTPTRDGHGSNSRILSLPGILIMLPASRRGRSVTLPPEPRRACKPCRQPIRLNLGRIGWERQQRITVRPAPPAISVALGIPPSVANRRMGSASRPACDLNSPTSHPPSSLKRSTIPAKLPHCCAGGSPIDTFGYTGAANCGCRELRWNHAAILASISHRSGWRPLSPCGRDFYPHVGEST